MPGPPPSNPPTRGSSHPHSSLCTLGRAERPPLLNSTADCIPPSPLPLPSPPSRSPHPARHASPHPTAHRLPPRPGRCGCHRRRHCTTHGPAGTLREGRLRAPREPPPPLPAAAARGNGCPPWQATATAASQGGRRGVCAQGGGGGGAGKGEGEVGSPPPLGCASPLSAGAALQDSQPRQRRTTAAAAAGSRHAVSRRQSHRIAAPAAGGKLGWMGRRGTREGSVPATSAAAGGQPLCLSPAFSREDLSRETRDAERSGAHCHRHEIALAFRTSRQRNSCNESPFRGPVQHRAARALDSHTSRQNEIRWTSGALSSDR